MNSSNYTIPTYDSWFPLYHSRKDCSYFTHLWWWLHILCTSMLPWESWYDWAYVSFIEQNKCGIDQENLYPSKIFGFVEFPCNIVVQCAVVQCSVSTVPWDIPERKFILEFYLGTYFNTSFVIVPVSSIINPVCVFPSYDSIDSTSFFVVFPKQNWSNYFGMKVRQKML